MEDRKIAIEKQIVTVMKNLVVAIVNYFPTHTSLDLKLANSAQEGRKGDQYFRSFFLTIGISKDFLGKHEL